ncbi:MAG: hypothetical protein AB8B56_09795 [Crocinitomicaceae bacterium]
MFLILNEYSSLISVGDVVLIVRMDLLSDQGGIGVECSVRQAHRKGLLDLDYSII